MELRLENVYVFLDGLKNDARRVGSFLFVRIFFILILAVNISNWALAANIFSQINAPQMALHFTVDFGIDYYGSVRKIFILPALGLLLWLINSCLMLIFSKNKDLAYISYLLLSSSLFSNIILFASLLSVYFLNFK